MRDGHDEECVAHVSNLFPAGEQWDASGFAAAAGVLLVPSVQCGDAFMWPAMAAVDAAARCLSSKLVLRPLKPVCRHLRQAFEAEVLLRLLVSYRTLARAHFLPAAPLTYPICRVERPAEYAGVLMAKDASLAHTTHHILPIK